MDVCCPARSRVLSWALLGVAACTLATLPARSADAAGTSGDVRLVVGFGAGASAAQIADAATEAGARVLSDIADLHARVLSVPSSAAAGALQKLRANGRVRFGPVTPRCAPERVRSVVRSGGSLCGSRRGCPHRPGPVPRSRCRARGRW